MQNKCLDCDKHISPKSKRCRYCSMKTNRQTGFLRTEETRQKIGLANRGKLLGKPNYARRRPTQIISGIEHYRCGRCGEFFPKEGFYRDKRTRLGITSKCKTCHIQTALTSRDKENARRISRLYMRRARQANPEIFRERERSRLRIKDHKYVARLLLNCAIRRGDMQKPDCCDECAARGRVTGHHENYSKPYDVIWLCYECHGKRHRKEVSA